MPTFVKVADEYYTAQWEVHDEKPDGYLTPEEYFERFADIQILRGDRIADIHIMLVRFDVKSVTMLRDKTMEDIVELEEMRRLSIAYREELKSYGVKRDYLAYLHPDLIRNPDLMGQEM